jgi:hypothetical protein
MQSFLDPAILFFVFGILAGALGSNLEIPPQIARFLSLYLLMALGLSVLCGLSPGNAALLMVLAASASYIAVPTVVRHAIPEANPSLYFGMSLGLTFPFNILLGIPLYVSVAQRVIGEFSLAAVLSTATRR